MITTFKEVATNDTNLLVRAFLNGATIRDCHDNSVINRDCSLVRLQDPERPLCLFLHGARAQSLNAVRLAKDNNLHLSQMAIGGVVSGELTQEAVEEYNSSVTFDGIKIAEWIDRDGTIHSAKVDV